MSTRINVFGVEFRTRQIFGRTKAGPALSGPSNVRYETVGAVTQDEAIQFVKEEFSTPKTQVDIEHVRTVAQNVLVPSPEEPAVKVRGQKPPVTPADAPPATSTVQ